ncbi:MAG: LamG-like jellyroll fold domain-containing protein [Bacteroidota bacterium]|nr:LamG-like jellyroll fold domain-containing protein [Bacteroidota bacterium]
MKKYLHLIIITLLFSNVKVLSQISSNALNFDGLADYVSAPLTGVFKNIETNEVTIEAWIKPDTNKFSRILFAQLDTNDFINISIANNNEIVFYVYSGGNNSISTIDTVR